MWNAGRRVPSAVFILLQSSLHVTASGPPSSTGRSGTRLLERRAARRGRRRRSRSAARAASLGRSPASPARGGRSGGSAGARRRRRRRRSSVARTTCSTRSPATACSAAHLARKYGTVAPGVGAEGAHEHDPPHAGLARRLDEVPRACRHDALEGRRRAFDDRDEVDDRPHATRGCQQRGGIGDVAADELAVDALERRRALRRAHHRPDRMPSAARSRVTWRPTNPLAPVTRIIARPRSSASTGSGSGRAGPGTSSRARPTRTASRPAPTSARTTAGRSSSPGRS